MKAIKLLLAFLPWIVFKIITMHHSLASLKIGIIVGFIVSIILAVTGIHKGVIVIGGVLFFSFGAVTVVFMDNMWVIRHTAILANGTLASLSWLSMIIKRPFTMAYARKEVDKKYWASPQFIRKSYVITGAWASVFTINAIINVIKINRTGTAGWVYEAAQAVFIISGTLITLYYPNFFMQGRGKT